MVKSMLSPTKPPAGGERGERSPFSSPYSILPSSPIAARRSSLEERRRPAARFHKGISPGPPEQIYEASEEEDDREDNFEDRDVHEDDDAGEQSPLLPIFSAEHLDSLPVYNITHTIRLLVVTRCETTLTWDQLRSPQVSQFLVKPIQQQIRTSHFSKATLYALMANCLQFDKEVQTNPGNSGVSKTRATICELLAIRLLKEFTTRELIGTSGTLTPGPNWNQKTKTQPRAARISALEIAIRAQAKRLLAHPLVVQQLEAIWAGTIIFHSAADNLHRPPVKVTPNQNKGYGAFGSKGLILQASPERLQPGKQRDHLRSTAFAVRRSVTLYDPQQASIFKLSRLRVPRYRQFLSTCSFAILLGLYLAVLIQRSLNITALEVVFWFWSAGFMLDEVVGFNEQGFSLYIMSFWNTFDVGILLLLVCYYGMRLCGVLMTDARKQSVANMAYDLLAANAVLLFPRLFSVLDHYRYFSQLLIAFRMMAVDLVAVFVLIVISCSGFFVAFTLSFGTNDYDAASVAYALFQMLMGFTPAAWENWETYNLLGKAILTLFLFICHFLIVTILITVLTNSFMAIVQNANEEHQFVFAVNTISMVKSDALFSYIAPANVIAWLLAPVRFVIPFRQFVRLNRTVIKATHFPILLIIYAYERLVLTKTFFEPTELVEHRGRPGLEVRAFEAPNARLNLFSPKQGRLREPSVATFQQDRALEEVFRRPFRESTIRNTQKSQTRRKTSNVVNHWMQNMGPNGTASPPIEQDLSIVDRLEGRHVVHRPSRSAIQRQRASRGRNFTEATMSVASDPEEFVANQSTRQLLRISRETSQMPATSIDGPTQTDADGDDELVTNEEEDLVTLDRPSATPGDITHRRIAPKDDFEDYFQHTPTAKPRIPHFDDSKPPIPSQLAVVRTAAPSHPRRVKQHSRIPSTTTILYDPLTNQSSSNSSPKRKVVAARNSARNIGTVTTNNLSTSAGRRTPKRGVAVGAARAVPRPIMPPRTALRSAPDLAGMLALDTRHHRRSSPILDLGSDLGDNKAVGGGFVGAVPASFATQMAYASAGMNARNAAERSDDDQSRMSKLMLARMNTLEEGFREVIREVKDMRRDEAKIGRMRSKKEARGSGGRTGEEKEKAKSEEVAFAMDEVSQKGSFV
ncbi:MAG: hypothetical protein Q9217_004276 [Psora testacea]